MTTHTHWNTHWRSFTAVTHLLFLVCFFLPQPHLTFHLLTIYQTTHLPTRLRDASSSLSSSPGLGEVITHDSLLTNSSALKEMVEPFTNEKLLREVIRQWTTPLPREYLYRPLIISGPSGVGKGRLTGEMMRDYHKFFRKIVTYTTRRPRAKEVSGRQYHFLSDADFCRLNSTDFFLESATIHNHRYGVSRYSWLLATQQYSAILKLRREVRERLEGEEEEALLYRRELELNEDQNTVRIPLLELDLQGVQFFRSAGKRLRVRPQFLFMQPPSVTQLKQRLLERDSETDEEMELRLQNAEKDLNYVAKHKELFDRVLHNDDLTLASNAFFRAVRDW